MDVALPPSPLPTRHPRANRRVCTLHFPRTPNPTPTPNPSRILPTREGNHA